MSEAHDNHVIGGYKATLSNPNASDEAKEHAKQVLADAGQSTSGGADSTTGNTTSGGEHENRVLGGYKATLSNPNTSDEAKEHAKEVLETGQVDSSNSGSSEEEKHNNRVLGGYKATLKNPNVGEEAKEHAKEVLEEAGAL